MEYIKAFFTGMKTGIDYWEVVVFDNKIPRGICWLIAIITMPINIIVMVILLASKKAIDWYEYMDFEINEKKQEAE